MSLRPTAETRLRMGKQLPDLRQLASLRAGVGQVREQRAGSLPLLPQNAAARPVQALLPRLCLAGRSAWCARLCGADAAIVEPGEKSLAPLILFQMDSDNLQPLASSSTRIRKRMKRVTSGSNVPEASLANDCGQVGLSRRGSAMESADAQSQYKR